MQRDELKEKPFCLKDGQIDWVENTLKDMSLDEKLGQMICPGEFFCLDVCLKVLPVFADRGKTILLGCLNRVGKFGRDVKKDVKMRFYLLEKVSIIQVR